MMLALNAWLLGLLVASTLMAAIACIALAASSYGSKLPLFSRICVWSIGFCLTGHAVPMLLHSYLAGESMMSLQDRIAIMISIAVRVIVTTVTLMILYRHYHLEYIKNGSHCQLWSDMTVLRSSRHAPQPSQETRNA